MTIEDNQLSNADQHAADSANQGASAGNNGDSGNENLAASTNDGNEHDTPAALQAAADALAGKDEADDLPTDKPASPRMKALLDKMSGDAPAGKTPPAADDEGKEGDENKAAQEGGKDLEDAALGKHQAGAPKTPEQEESELLEGVKSERGRERIREMFAKSKQHEQDINEFRELVTSTKMSPQEFAQSLEFGRLVNSGEEKDLRVALEMVEQQRAQLYQRLGVEAPGVDLLAGHDDLKTAVDNMEITRERALELAKYRKQDAELKARQNAQQQSTQEQVQFQQTVQTAAQAMESYLNTRANEVDHPVRTKAIAEHFKNPANLQAFVQTYRPDQWLATLKMMYDGVVVPKAPAAHQPQPLRSRPATLGTPAAAGKEPIDRIAAHMDNLGL